MTNQHDIRIQGGYVPKNHNPHNPEAIQKWMDSISTVYDYEAAIQADRKYNELQGFNALREKKTKFKLL